MSATGSIRRGRRLRAAAVTGVAAALTAGGALLAGPAQAAAELPPQTGTATAATGTGTKIAEVALGQFLTTNPEVKKRRYEGDAKGGTERNNCNFYTGFWTNRANFRWDRTSAPRHGTITNSQACGTSKGFMKIKKGGVWKKTWVDVPWTSRAWCADFAKFTWYWGGAKITGLNAGADSFRLYGLDPHNKTWHTGSQVASGAYVPRAGDVVAYDDDHDGRADHVGVVTKYSTRLRKYHSMEGNTSVEGLEYKKAQNAVAPRVLGYASPVSL
ncbi:CHAP domain-containing protein [Streptomyces sp. NPDC093225]|uniref:CHAP domain-containing protein n=1 Tax=Streptomyces sp. NPDC093225 TaxID=3366034 RepID=UPI00381756BB